LNGGGRISTEPPAASIAARADADGVHLHAHRALDAAAAEHLHERALVGDAAGHEGRGIDLGDAEGVDRVEVDRLVLDAEGIGEALELRDALLERHLTTLEAAGDRVAGVLALGAAAGGLAALAADAAADALARAAGAVAGSDLVDAHVRTPSSGPW
jgi:hypothetical protein